MKGVNPLAVIVLLIGLLIVLFWAANTGLVVGNIRDDVIDLENITSIPAENVSNGTFGANVGNGNYRFPNNLTIDETLTVTGFNTGNVLLNEIDATFGTAMGAIGIGASQIFVSDIVLASLNISDSMVFRNTPNGNPLEFLFATSDNLIRLAIPTAGKDLALYNPRSMMVGGDLGQSFNDNIINCTAQGYNLIDCDTSLTGADLGIDNDLEVQGTIFGANLTGSVNNITLIANNTMTNSFFRLTETRQTYGSNLDTVEFLASPHVNFTNLLGNTVIQFDANSVNVLEELEILNEDFDYPTGGYSAIIHEPTVSNIDEGLLTLRLVELSPTWLYTEPITMGTTILTAMSFIPKLEPDGLATGTDLMNLVGGLFAPTFQDPEQKRTGNQLIAIFAQPRLRKNGTVNNVFGVRSQLSILDNSSATNVVSFQAIGAINTAGTVTNRFGVRIQSQTGATNNFGLAVDGTQDNYFDGNVGFNDCQDPDHDINIGGTGTGCNTGTWSEIDAGQSTFTVSSSSKIKENFSPVSSANILEKVKNVPVYTYDFKPYSYTRTYWNDTLQDYVNITREVPAKTDRIGFKAEDFAPIFGRSDGTTLSGDEIMYAMWLSIQELIAENDLLKERITILENR